MDNAIVLIIDDEDYVADLLAVMLEKDGLQTAVAYNGRVAIQLAQSRHFDLIITDMMMPYFKGEDVIGTLLTLEQTQGMPIILMSAMPRPDHVAANVTFVEKPFDVDDMLTLIHKKLDGDIRVDN